MKKLTLSKNRANGMASQSVFTLSKHKKNVLSFPMELREISHNEMRRHRSNIYTALASELYEEGCRITARYFECLVEKELKQHRQYLIRYMVKDERPLLLAIHENVKLAEKAARLASCGGMKVCLQLFYQTLNMLHNYVHKFNWLLKELYVIFIRIAESQCKANDEDCFEVKARMFCNYAIYLGDKTENLEECILNFTKSQELCRGQLWKVDSESDACEHCTLHEFVNLKLSRILIEYAKVFMRQNAELGLELAHKAIVSSAEITTIESLANRQLFCEAFLLKITYLKDMKRCDEAMENIACLEKYLHINLGIEYLRKVCKLFLLKGQCYLLTGQPLTAKRKFNQVLLISRKYEFRLYEAKSLFQLGKLYMEHHDEAFKAREAFELAKEIYIELGDLYKIQRTTFQLAHMQAKQNFKELQKLIAKTTFDRCSLYKLRRWKNQAVPFWSPQTQSKLSYWGSTARSHLQRPKSFDISHFNLSQADHTSDHSYTDLADMYWRHSTKKMITHSARCVMDE